MAQLAWRRAHRLMAGCLALFIVAHLGNHAMVFFGSQAHIVVQDGLRVVYRHPFVEPALILAVVAQLAIGLRLAWKRPWPRRFWPRAQRISGLLVAFFLTQHVTAALVTRWFKPEIDTNVYWAAAVVSRPEFAVYFAPYYVLGVAGLFVHVAAFVALRGQRRAAVFVAIAGAVYGLAIVIALMRVELPPNYAAYLDAFWF